MARNVQVIDYHIGKKIEKLRVQHMLTQRQMSILLGVTYQQIQKYMFGYNRVPINVLYEICCIFNVTMDYFIENYEDKSEKLKGVKNG